MSVWHFELLINSTKVSPWCKFLAPSRIKLFWTMPTLSVPQVLAFSYIRNQFINIIEEASVTPNSMEHLSLNINKWMHQLCGLVECHSAYERKLLATRRTLVGPCDTFTERDNPALRWQTHQTGSVGFLSSSLLLWWAPAAVCAKNLLVQHAFLYSPYMNTRASYVKLIGSVTAGKQLQSMASTTAEEIIIKHP